MKIKALRS